MATYKKLSEYEINAAPNDGDLIPTLVDNGDGTYENTLMEYSSLKGTPGSNGTNGQGVPIGGTVGQVLAKTSSTDYATTWQTLNKTSMGLDNVDNTSDLNKPVSTAVADAIASAVAAAILQSKMESYPIGSLYMNADDSTNPGTLLGFGTWSAYAVGQVPVGKAPSGTFATAGATGGTETNTLVQANLPNVQGSIGLHGGEGGSMFIDIGGVFNVRRDVRGSYRGPNGVTGASQSVYGSINFDLNGGTQTALNNRQPYVVVYIWRRTA